MDIYDYLKKDHETVSDLFKKFENKDSFAGKQQIFEKIAKEVLLHAKSEEKTFYATLIKKGIDSNISREAKKEHKEVEKLILKLFKSKNINGTWERGVLKLKELIEHHVGEEEGKIFRKAMDLISEEEAIALKSEMAKLKNQLKKGTTKKKKTTKKSKKTKKISKKTKKKKSVKKSAKR